MKKYWTYLVARLSRTRWFHEKIGALVAADLVIFIVPSDILISLGVLLRPKQWLRMVAAGAAGSVVGSLAMGTLVKIAGPWIMRHWIEPIMSPTTLEIFRLKIANWGGLALTGIVFTPLPPSGAIALYVMGGGSVWLSAFWIGLGRLIKYFGLCLIVLIAHEGYRRRKRMRQ